MSEDGIAEHLSEDETGRVDHLIDPEIDRSEHVETTNENDGRSVKIDLGFYNIQVWGDAKDSFDDVMEKADKAADRAKKDFKELDDNYDNGDDTHYR